MNYKIFKTDLKPWLKKFFFEKFSYIIKAITGTIITITDGIRKKINELKLSKESTQETTTGKNKYNINDLSKNNCTYVINDNSIVITATGTYGYIEQKIDNLDITKQYRLSFNGDNAAWITVLDENKTKKYETYSTKAINFTPTTSTMYARIYVTTSSSSSTKTFTDIQVEEGTTTTDYEPYTGGQASPNPSYPQEVKTVIGYRNLLDNNIFKNKNFNTSTGEITTSDNKLLINEEFIVLPSGTYTLSLDYVNQSWLLVYDDEGNFKRDYYQSSWNTQSEFEFTITNYHKIRIGFNRTINSARQNISNQYLKVMLSKKSNIPLPYVPYGNNYVNIKIGGKNKLGYPSFTNVTVGNITFTNNKGVYTISTNGTSTTPTSTNDYEIENYTIQQGDYIHYKNSFIDSHIGFTLIFSDNTSYFNSFAASINRKFSLEDYVGKTIVAIRFNYNAGYTFNGTCSPMIYNSSTETSYEPYVLTNIPIPLNNNEIAGIGDYKDELIIDKNGHCWLNKKTGKKIFDGSESGWVKSSFTGLDRFVINNYTYLNNINSKCNYFIKMPGVGNTQYAWTNNAGTQFIINYTPYGTTTLEQWKEWVSTHNLIFYQPLKTENLIDLNYTVDIRLFKGTNNISNSDDMDMSIKYYSK